MMKQLNVVVTSVLTAVIASLATVLLITPDREDTAVEAATSTAGDVELARSLASIEQRIEQLATDLDEARMAMAVSDTGGGRVAVGEVEAIVARYLQDGRRMAADAPLDDEAVLAAQALSRFETMPLEDIMALLTDPAGPEARNWQEVMHELAKAGRLDEIITAMEQYAEENPNDPDAQLMLGATYLQKIFEGGQGPETGRWATLADRSFDDALALDDTHYQARFAKAVSLSHWPAVFGKTGEAISQFETLIGQQESSSGSELSAEPYVFLGSLYQQTGNTDKALEAWRAGLARFPDDDTLRSQLDLIEGNGR
jgi:tetratricopeptide (TPR) repeat protein